MCFLLPSEEMLSPTGIRQRGHGKRPKTPTNLGDKKSGNIHELLLNEHLGVPCSLTSLEGHQRRLVCGDTVFAGQRLYIVEPLRLSKPGQSRRRALFRSVLELVLVCGERSSQA